jgi:hypothetical protein
MLCDICNEIYQKNTIKRSNFKYGLELWCLTPLSTIFRLYPSVLLVEETGGPGEIHRPATNDWQILSHNFVLSKPRHERYLLCTY